MAARGSGVFRNAMRTYGKTWQKVVDMTGLQVGMMTVVERVGSDKGGNAMWRCVCACGRTKTFRRSVLRRKVRHNPLSCGRCTKRRIPAKQNPMRWKPVGPLRAWLLEKLERHSWAELVQLIGDPWKDTDRILRRQVYESKEWVSVGVVDTILTGAGVAMWELYPDD